ASPLSDLELDGQQHPHGHWIVAAARGLEAPAAHRLDRRLVEIGMTGRLLDEDVTDTAVDQHVNLEQGRALDALTERGRGIARAYLVAALWPRTRGDGARAGLSTRRRGHRRRGRRGRPTRALARQGRGGRAGSTRARRGGFAGRPRVARCRRSLGHGWGRIYGGRGRGRLRQGQLGE